MGVEPKIGEFYHPKWMVYFMEKPYEQMDDLGVPLFLETSIYILPWKLTCPLKINDWKMYFLLK